jgi:hypothetical protein
MKDNSQIIQAIEMNHYKMIQLMTEQERLYIALKPPQKKRKPFTGDFKSMVRAAEGGK